MIFWLLLKNYTIGRRFSSNIYPRQWRIYGVYLPKRICLLLISYTCLNQHLFSGCHMVDSCSNIQTGEQFGRLLRHNFNRHFSTNRAPLGLHFHASWLKSKREFKDELIKFIEEMLKRNDVYFVNMLQVSSHNNWR